MIKIPAIAEEILQDIFTVLWQKREAIEIENGLTPYLYRMAQHRVCDYFRKLKRDKRLLERWKQLITNAYEPVEESVFYNESTAYLLRALNKLTPQQKKVYELCRLEGYSYKQAAAQLGISPFTVKEYLGLATKTVRAYFREYMDMT